MFNLAFFTVGALLIGIYLLFMLIIVQLKKDNSIGNFTWGGGVLLITLFTLFYTNLYLPRHILITMLIIIWASRLILYLYLRYKKGADPRFIEWENHWGKFALLISFGWIVIMQGALMLIMSLPSIIVNTSIKPGLNLLDFLGFIIWVIGFFFEAVGDYQLFRFTKNPSNKGKILDTGLWKYTRHPNYFGEIVMWWGIYLIAVSVPCGWSTIVAPLIITILLIFFTGIPWTEAVFRDNQEYQEYKKRTNMLIPGWPKGSASRS